MMDPVNSTTFIKRPRCMTDIQEKFLYSKELLSSRIFLGYYQERRYISVLGEYRDVVVVSHEETDLISHLDRLKRKWSDVKNFKWVGFTSPGEIGFPNSYCFCVKLTNLPFGHYWFQIKHVKLVEEELFFHLKCIRKSQPTFCKFPTEARTGESPVEKNENEEASSSREPYLDIPDLDPKKLISRIQSTCLEAIYAIKPFITLGNFILVLRVGSGLMIALVLGMITILGHLGEFILRFMRECSILVNAFTPITVQLIDSLSKIIGGIFILLARMFGNVYQVNNQQMHRNQIYYSLPNSGESANAVDWRERNRNLRREFLSNSIRGT